jgi:Tfp pilus assembly protein PilX
MNTLHTSEPTRLSGTLLPVEARLASASPIRCTGRQRAKQRGVVLFLTLVALLAMSLAAVALIRSVDTNTMISGNLAFKQSAITSADAGIQAAMDWLSLTANSTAILAENDQVLAHPFNTTNLAAKPGYYSTFDPALDVTADTTWNIPNGTSQVFSDKSGNSSRYIIQRMCRYLNLDLFHADCLFNSVSVMNNPTSTPNGPSPPPMGGRPAQLRITVQTTGVSNTVSYVQSFVF